MTTNSIRIVPDFPQTIVLRIHSSACVCVGGAFVNIVVRVRVCFFEACVFGHMKTHSPQVSSGSVCRKCHRHLLDECRCCPREFRVSNEVWRRSKGGGVLQSHPLAERCTTLERKIEREMIIESEDEDGNMLMWPHDSPFMRSLRAPKAPEGSFLKLDEAGCPVVAPKPVVPAEEPVVPEPAPFPAAEDEVGDGVGTIVLDLNPRPPPPGFLLPRGSGGHPGGSVAGTGGRNAGDAGPGSSSSTAGSTTPTPNTGPTTNAPNSTDPAADPAQSTEAGDPGRPPQTPAPNKKNPPRLPLEVDLKHSEKSDSVTLTQVLCVTVGIVCVAAAVSLLIRLVVMRAMETDVSRGAGVRDQDGSRRRREVRFKDEPSRQDGKDIGV